MVVVVVVVVKQSVREIVPTTSYVETVLQRKQSS